MGVAVLFTILIWYAIYLLLYLSDVFNVYIFERMSQDMQSLVADLEFDYIISERGMSSSPF